MGGSGAAAMLPASLSLIAAIWDEPAQRARAIAIWSGVSGSAVAVGPLVGGALIGLRSWRLIFLVNLPVVAAALAGSRGLSPGHLRPRAVDWRGALWSIVSLGCLIGALIEAGRTGLSEGTLLLTAAALAGLVVFGLGQLHAPAPMVPRELWRNRALRRSCGGSLGMNLVGNGTLIVLAFLFQFVQGRDAFAAGLATLPVFLPLTIVPLAASGVLARVRPARLIRAGFAIGVLGQLALAVSVWRSPHTVSTSAPGMLLTGVALGVLVTPLVASAVATAPAHSGLVGGLNNAARQTGTSVGVALFGAVAGPVAASDATTRMAWCFALGAVIWSLGGLLAGRN
jgi:DHA2 family methylenomycin A resistance protein-like MFS transporter